MIIRTGIKDWSVQTEGEASKDGQCLSREWREKVEFRVEWMAGGRLKDNTGRNLFGSDENYIEQQGWGWIFGGLWTSSAESGRN